MKTGIITFHFVNNYGGALQAYALRRYVADTFGVDAELIDYRNWFIRTTDAIRMLPVTANYHIYGPWLRAYPKMRRRRRLFAAFMKNRIPLSRRYDFGWQLNGHGEDYGLLICGSDQIWNPTLTFGLAKPYFLRFAGPNSRRVSYAASVGPSIRDKGKMLAYVRDLNAVSIRETTPWLEQGLGKPVEHHIDPTLLLPTEAWRSMCKAPAEKGEYIVSYFMQQNDKAYGYLEQIRRETGLRVRDISRYGYKPSGVDESLVDVGPEEFVGLFASAARVCTNSFHGLVFALIFNKPVDFVPMHRFGGRVEALCRLLNLKQVPVDGGAYYHIEYDVAEKDRILEDERRRTRAYLEREIRMAYDQD